MKKLFSLLTLALLTMSAWAATSTLTFTAQCGGTGTASDGAVWTVTSDAAESVYDSTKGIHYGTSKVAVSYLTLTTSDIPGTITKITVNASGASQQTPALNVTVGGAAFGSEVTLSSTATEYTLEGSASGTINVTISQPSNTKALYCKSISVEYENGSTPEIPTVATPTFNPYNAEGYHFTGSLPVTVSCATEAASIYLYKVVDGEIDYTTMQYIFQEGVVYVTENTTFAAMASKGDYTDSEFAYATYILDNDNPDPQDPEYIAFFGSDFDAKTGEFSIEKSGVTINCSNGSVGDQIRFYKYSNFSFTSTAGNITKIEFYCTANNDSQYGPGSVTLNEGENGTYTYEAKVGTWTGSATSVNFTATANQMRTTEIRVWIDGEIVVVVNAPNFNPADGTTFTESLDVTITGPVGSNIVYMLNDGDEITAASPVTVTLNETTTILAYAELDGVESNMVEATYTKVDAPVYEPWEGTEHYVAADDKGDFSGSAGAYNVFKESRPGINLAISNGTIAAEQGGVYAYRIYKNQTITFTSQVGNITMIQFIGVSGNPVSNFGEVEGMTYDGHNGTWIGDADTVVFTASEAQVRATEIIVTVGERPAVLYAPVITPENNTVFAGSQVVTITCATEGAQVYYMINDGEATLYEGPFSISESCKVSAYSVLGEQTSTIVSANYILGTEINNIAEGNTVDNFYIYNGEAVVTYQDKDNGLTWIRDNSGSIVIYGYYVPTMEQGDVIEAGWSAKYTVYRNVPEFTNPKDVTKSEDQVAVEPYVRETLTAENVNEYVVLKGISVLADESNSKKFYNAADSLTLYNQFNLADSLVNFEAGKLYDVEGICYIFGDTIVELYITKVTEATTPVEEWMLGDVNHDRTIDVLDVTALISYILGNDPGEFYLSEANVDGDAEGAYDVGDVTAMIAIILNN